MRSFLKFISVSLLFALGSNSSSAQVHPMQTLGREIFETFRQSNFSAFYQRSIFALNEESFKNFLFQIRNKSIRDDLIAHFTQVFPPHSSNSEKWNIAFKHLWRKQLRHLSRYDPAKVRIESFIPILKEASEYGIQWETTKLLAIEVHLPVSWENGRFQIKGDLDIDDNGSNIRVLHLDRNLDYRFTLDKLTYSKTFMIGLANEDSDQIYKKGILGNGSGQGDILVRFGPDSPSKLFYFCPDETGAGGPISIKNFDSPSKPNQKTDILLTFSYGQPERAYQIKIKDALISPQGPIFTERPVFLGEVSLPRGLSFPN